MGLAELGFDPIRVASNLIHSDEDKMRRERARERFALYNDNCEPILDRLIGSVFAEEAVRTRLYKLSPIACANSFLKRVSDELARPIYAVPPLRTVDPGSAQGAYNGLLKEIRANERLDLASRLVVGGNRVLIYVYYVEGSGMCAEVLAPHQFSRIRDPRMPSSTAGIVYAREVYNSVGESVTHWVVWDDQQHFEMDSAGALVRDPVRHNFGRMPFVEICRPGTNGPQAECHAGADLVATSKAGFMLSLLALKNHKSQSHIQLAFVGNTEGFSKDQTLDEESVLTTSGDGQLFPINLQGDPGALLRTKEMLETTTAANYGISRDRLNQRQGEGGEENGLKERTAELMQMMRRAEMDLFDVLKTLSREHPEYQIADSATVKIDFGLLHHRVDRKTLLEIRQVERSMGLRSGVDDALEDNPELEGDREAAMEYIDDRMAEEAVIVEKRRALNIAKDVSSDAPGQSPADNGRMGPAVRDGKMTRDEAARMANEPPATD